MAVLQKSNMGSAAALLVMVAALVVGTCAPGARADDSTVALVNICNVDSVVLLYNNAVSSVVIPAGLFVNINLSILKGLVGPVYFRKNGVLSVLNSAGLSQLLGLTGVIYRLEIVCNGKCGAGVLTIIAYAQVYVDGVKVGIPISASACADLFVA